MELDARAVVAGDDAGDRLVRANRAGCRRAYAVADAQAVTRSFGSAFDRARTHLDERSGLSDPRLFLQPQTAQPAEEHVRECRPLIAVAALVHVEDERPRRPGLVVGVAID